MRLGIVGTGGMAAEMARAARHVPGLTVSAVLSRRVAGARTFCDTHAPGARATEDLSDALGGIDALYIATPPGIHASYLRATIAAGVPVMCEKPLTLSSADCAEILGKARADGVLVMEAIWTLALPAYQALRDLVRERAGGAGGQLFFDFSMPLIASEDAHYFNPGQGGVLLDRAVYGYAAAIAINGAVQSQEVHVTRRADGLDTSADLRLTHEGGGASFITLSFDRLGPNRLDVALPEGLASLAPGSLLPEILSWKAADLSGGAQGARAGLKSRLKALPMLRALKARAPARGAFLGYGATCYVPILTEFKAAVEAGRSESALVPHALSQSIAALTEAARGTADP